VKFYGDYHTHTKYSDAGGKVKVIDMVKAAIERGFKEVAITDHGFANPILSLSRKKFPRYVADIEKAREEVGDKIRILLGIEANLISLDGEIDLKEDELGQFDIILAAYHPGATAANLKDFFRLTQHSNLISHIHASKSAIKRNTKAAIKMLERYPIAIYPHMNTTFKVDVKEVSKACADLGVFVELNAKHADSVPKVIEDILSTEAKLIVNSDGHSPKAVGEFSEIEKILEIYQIDKKRIVNAGKVPKFRKKV
jgi:putative hydrolase